MTERVNDKDIDFNLIFASAAPSVRELEEAQYLKGWSFLGDEIPPEFEDFDSVMRIQDKKAQILNQKIGGFDDKIAAVDQKFEVVDQKIDDEVAQLEKKLEKAGGGYVTQTMWHPSRDHLPAGCLPGDGQTVDRATWPSLFEEVEAGNVPVVDEADWLSNPKLRGCYTLGDGVNTFRVPDYNGMSQGSLGRIFLSGDGVHAGEIGHIQESANKKHNHTLVDNGHTHGVVDNGHSHGVSDGGHSHTTFGYNEEHADQPGLAGGGGNLTATPQTDRSFANIGIQASTSNVSVEVATSGITIDGEGENDAHPTNVAGCYIIRGAGEKMNEGAVDALQLATQVNALQNKIEKLEEQGNAGYVGKVDWHPLRSSVPAGRIPSDGQLLSRDLYPSLWDAVRNGEVPVVSEQEWNAEPLKRGAYTVGDGATNFRVPDYNGKSVGSLGAAFMRGDGLNALANGLIQNDAIRNITGYAGAIANYKTIGNSGAIALDADQGPMYINGHNTGAWAAMRNISIDASRIVPTGSDNRPVNVSGCWVIQYAGAVVNSGYVDAVKAIDQIAKLDSRVGKIESREQLFEIMYPYGSQGSPSILKPNQRLVFNPPSKFDGRDIQCKLQLKYNGFWHDWHVVIYGDNSSTSTGATASVVINEDSTTDATPRYIVIQTATDALGTESRFDCNPAGLAGWLVEAPYRVLIWSVD